MSALEKVKESLGSLVSSADEVSVRRLVAKAEPKDLKAIFQKLLEDFKQDFYLDFLGVVDYPDEKQIEATLVQCIRCRKFWYMTRLAFVCAVCRRLAGGR